MEAVWGGRTETLSCAGYDHNWVRVYKYADDAAPILPKGTLLHITAYFDTTANNRNVIDPRNWGGLGHRSIDNMLIALNQGIELTDEEFAKEVAQRRARLSLREGQIVPGCPLCGYPQLPGPQPAAHRRGRHCWRCSTRSRGRSPTRACAKPSRKRSIGRGRSPPSTVPRSCSPA